MESSQSVDQASGIGTIRLSGRLDVLEAPILQGQVLAVLGQGCSSLVIDLTDLSFVDSAGLAVLVRARRDTQSLGGDITLIRPHNEDAMRIFRLTQFDRVFSIVDRAPDPIPNTIDTDNNQ